VKSLASSYSVAAVNFTLATYTCSSNQRRSRYETCRTKHLNTINAGKAERGKKHTSRSEQQIHPRKKNYSTLNFLGSFLITSADHFVSRKNTLM